MGEKLTAEEAAPTKPLDSRHQSAKHQPTSFCARPKSECKFQRLHRTICTTSLQFYYDDVCKHPAGPRHSSDCEAGTLTATTSCNRTLRPKTSADTSAPTAVKTKSLATALPATQRLRLGRSDGRLPAMTILGRPSMSRLRASWCQRLYWSPWQASFGFLGSRGATAVAALMPLLRQPLQFSATTTGI